eukprot:CAMPEP_0180112616 /NCGR_PEP_ID=MMETSP0985-20121206/36303_1 /TAXON_ID=483367 /ORGANISM="non described non described, Strain CCMP 2436" /LENGTH=63 /DNA_ID=CAMNT_0022050983 /DNA_START=472 /DNA_END=663 /DNA_ORIENTATION=+
MDAHVAPGWRCCRREILTIGHAGSAAQPTILCAPPLWRLGFAASRRDRGSEPTLGNGRPAVMW